MEDNQIIELYFKRSEFAITETKNKYGKYCFYIAYHILHSNADAEECENDTYLRVWDSIPPKRPARFQAFIGKITRNIALNKYAYNNADKRAHKAELVADEFYECVQGKEFALDEEYIFKELINRFLASLPKRQRIIFMQRYWYFCSIKEIAACLGMRENNVKVILHRTRAQFKDFLKGEGVFI